MQNSVSPATLFSERMPCFVGSVINFAEASLPHSEKLVYHLNIHTVADFMLFMHNLPTYLDAHPEVINSRGMFPQLTWYLIRLVFLC
jgi:hypothetical protein